MVIPDPTSHAKATEIRNGENFLAALSSACSPIDRPQLRCNGNVALLVARLGLQDEQTTYAAMMGYRFRAAQRLRPSSHNTMGSLYLEHIFLTLFYTQHA